MIMYVAIAILAMADVKMKNIFVIIATTFLLLGCSSNPKKELIKEVVTFSNYDSISWDATIENYYDIFDWNNDVKEQFYAETSNIDLEFEVSLDYGNLRAAQKSFHHKLLPLRNVASQDKIEALDNAEALFDTVWLKYIRQDYRDYLMKDTYNQVMTPAMSDLIKVLNQQ